MIVRRFLGFAYIVALSASLTAQAPAETPKALTDAEFLKGAHLATDPGVERPKVTLDAVPKYTSEAMRAKIQGRVEVQLVVGVDGKVQRARVTESLDKVYGLDEAALEAAKQFRFTPGTLNGKAVPVAVNLSLSFALH